MKRLVILALVVAGTLVACGKDEVRPSASGDVVTTTTTSATATTAPPEQLKLTATEYSYGGASNLTFRPGALDVALTNNGKEEHQATIVRFKEGKTLGDLAAVAASDPGKLDTIIDVFGGPNAIAPGGVTDSAIQALGVGDYYFMCFIPAPDGQPHAAKGMVAPFKVEGEATGPAPANAPNTVALKEYSFGAEGVTDAKASSTKPIELKAGPTTFANEGEQLHEAAIYKPAPGKTAKDVIEYFKQQTPTGPPPITPSGGVAALDPGTSATTELAAGDYVYMCFLPDKADGAPHFTKGMIQAVTVK